MKQRKEDLLKTKELLGCTQLKQRNEY